MEIKGVSSITTPKGDKTAGAYKSKYSRPIASEERAGNPASLRYLNSRFVGYHERLTEIQDPLLAVTITKHQDERIRAPSDM